MTFPFEVNTRTAVWSRNDILAFTMAFSFFNSLTHTLEPFEPLQRDHVGVYSCGPTVYGTPSIGNYRAFLFADTLVRALRYGGMHVTWVMNITDVGHLVSDADEGEDKLELAAKKQHQSAWDVAKRYTEEFLRDLDVLNIMRPDVMPKATDHIPEQIRMVEELEKNGFTYRTSDGIYFDTSKVPEYGALAGQAIEDKQAGARVDVNPEKRHPSDFALWKFSPKGQKRDMEWDAPWGVGFPGWHIECSAMSTKYLGKLYDIHTGGADLRHIHHPNEMAQSYGACGTSEARVWMHNEFVLVDGGKMSKSLGNVYSVDDLVSHGVGPLAYRYFTFQAHYRRQLNFTFEALDAASIALKKLYRAVREWDQPAIGCAEYEERFLRALEHDLDMPQALAIVWELVHDTRMASSGKAQSLKKFDEVLGLNLMEYIAKPLVIPADVERLVHEREAARQQKDFARSDVLRDEIRTHGFTVEDTPTGPRLDEAA